MNDRTSGDIVSKEESKGPIGILTIVSYKDLFCLGFLKYESFIFYFFYRPDSSRFIDTYCLLSEKIMIELFIWRNMKLYIKM